MGDLSTWHGPLVACNESGWDFRNTGILCGVFVPNFGYVTATEWRETVSAAGMAVLTCRVKIPE